MKMSNVDLKRGRSKGHPRTVNVNIKVSEHLSKWIRRNEYSPTKLFMRVCELLGYKGK